jgi:predicted GNAT family acetyltransferase
MAVEVHRVRKNEPASRYDLIDGDAQVLGFVSYHLRDGIVVLQHTEIEASRRGNGLGAELVRGALDDVRATGATVDPRCRFAASVIEEHPEYRDLVAR